MSQGKTEFKFRVNADMTMVEGVIRNWLYANQFTAKPEFGANCYAFNDPIVKGKRGFEYYINGNDVIILAYVGTYKKPKALEGFVGAVMKQNYRNELAPLFEEIKKLENGSVDAATYATAQAVGDAAANQAQNNSLNTFMQQNNKNQQTLVIIGFVMSVVGLLLSCIGVTFGVILIILEFYFAIQGLKTSKKGLAIATIVLASVSIVITLGYLVLYVLYV